MYPVCKASAKTSMGLVLTALGRRPQHTPVDDWDNCSLPYKVEFQEEKSSQSSTSVWMDNSSTDDFSCSSTVGNLSPTKSKVDAKEKVMRLLTKAIEEQESELASTRQHCERHTSMAMIRYKSGNKMAAIVSAKQGKNFEIQCQTIQERLNKLLDLMLQLEKNNAKPGWVFPQIGKIKSSGVPDVGAVSDASLLAELEAGSLCCSRVNL